MLVRTVVIAVAMIGAFKLWASVGFLEQVRSLFGRQPVSEAHAQLRLKLEAKKGLVAFYTIEHAESPSDN